MSERVGVSSVGVSGVSAVSDVSECRSLTLLTLDRHDPRVSLSEIAGLECLSVSEECRRSVGGVSIDTS